MDAGNFPKRGRVREPGGLSSVEFMDRTPVRDEKLPRSWS